MTTALGCALLLTTPAGQMVLAWPWALLLMGSLTQLWLVLWLKEGCQ